VRLRGLEPPRGCPHGDLNAARIPNFATAARPLSLARSVPGVCEHAFVREPAEIEECLELRAKGMTATEIARRSGIPRATVRDWINGRVPRAGLSRCPTCGLAGHVRSALPPAYAYLLGAYLGDGCVSLHPRGVYRLRITLDTAYPGIIDEVVAAARAVMPASAVSRPRRPRSNCVDVSSYSKAWPCLLPQHGPGPKHERPIALQAWQWIHVEDHPELMLRGLIHSDGCRFMNTGRGTWRHPRYLFTNVSLDIQHIFCETCDLLGLRWTKSGLKTIYVSRKADVARMDEFIGPKA
jgi:Helix-turn-helix